MLAFWLGLLKGRGYKVRDEELNWTSPTQRFNDTMTRDEIRTPEGRTIRHTKAEDPTKVLGSLITMNGDDNHALNHRAACAWAVFGRWQHILTCKAAPVRKRLKLAEEITRTAMFWGAKTWNLREDQRQFLRRTQTEIRRKVLGMRPKQGESQESYWKRLYNKLAELRRDLKIRQWDDYWAKVVYELAGSTQEE